MLDNTFIPWDGWKIIRRIGKGSYGTVYEIERALGTYTEKAAMKVISIPPDQHDLEYAFSEGHDEKTITEMCKSYLDSDC